MNIQISTWLSRTGEQACRTKHGRGGERGFLSDCCSDLQQILRGVRSTPAARGVTNRLLNGRAIHPADPTGADLTPGTPDYTPLAGLHIEGFKAFEIEV
jgi:hypothetical protein